MPARRAGEVSVTPCRMDALAEGDLFVGPDYFTHPRADRVRGDHQLRAA
ncbi:hypothetical protein [Pseudonocardia kunmingensis]|nr:hypothetical protein [Pseudonocardia kunmingensis]